MDENIGKRILAMGFPSVRIMLYALAKKYDKHNIEDRIEEICHIQEIGCLNIDFFNKTENKKDTIFIFMKECTKDHNLDEQIDKLKPHIDEEKWKDVLKSLSSIILLTRSIYTSIYENNTEFIKELVGEDINKYCKLHVDPINTTLYLPDIDDRIGIFFEK